MQFISRAFQYFPRKFLLEHPRILAVLRSSRTRIFHASGAWKLPRHTCPYLFTSRLSFAWCSYSGTPRETPHLTSLFWASRTAEYRLCVLAFVSQHRYSTLRTYHSADLVKKQKIGTEKSCSALLATTCVRCLSSRYDDAHRGNT
jgi:hypothetical protein